MEKVNRSGESSGGLSCPWCGYSIRFGLFVCQACQADVVYGATARELSGALKLGFILGIPLAFLFDKLVGGFSSMTSVLVSALAVVGAASFGLATAVYFLRRGKPRFFRRTAL